jgi:AcrR family transcriptional regulator
MRAVAGRLGAVPMALYNHFATKEQLVDALLDRVLGRFQPAPPTDDWIEDLRAFAAAHRRLLADHPWAVAPLFAQPNPGVGAVRIGEHVLGILKRGGLSDDWAVAAFSGLIAINYGWSSFTAARDLDPEGPSHDVAAMLSQLPPAVFPLTVEVASAMGAYGSDEHYAFVLDQFLSGLRAAGAG